MSILKKIKTVMNRLFPLFTKIMLPISVLCLGISVAARCSSTFADGFNRYVSSFVRAILSYLTAWIPFSVAETILLFLPVLIICIVVVCIRKIRKDDNAERFLGTMFGVVLLMFSLFTLTTDVAYKTSPIEDKLNMDRREVSASELFDTAQILVQQINNACSDVRFSYMSFSDMPYDLDGLSAKLCDAYKAASKKYDFLPALSVRVKPIMLSEPMTYTHISGIYTYFTGEANINMNFPDYTIPYTTAHEMAHQRGVIREDEANFMAFLVCLESDDPYIRYSALLNMYEYVASALYSADSEKYYDTVSGLDLQVRYEMQAYREFYEKYQHTVVSNVSDSMNDFYLKSQGQAAGSRSYGQVVDLAVAYFREMTESESK